MRSSRALKRVAGAVAFYEGFKFGLVNSIFVIMHLTDFLRITNYSASEDISLSQIWNDKDLNDGFDICRNIIGLFTGLLVVLILFEEDTVDLITIEESLPEEYPLNLWEEMLDAMGYSTEEIPSIHCCPISHSIMYDPVIAYDGHIYDRSYITEWLRTNKKSPMENIPLENLTLICNKDKKSEIIEFVQVEQKKYFSVVKDVFFQCVPEEKLKEETSDKITRLVKGYMV